MRRPPRMIAAPERTGARLFYFEKIAPHTRLDGTEVPLAVWRGHCRQCGNAFRVTSPMPGVDGRITSKSFCRVHCNDCKRGSAAATTKTKGRS
jgi:hypothetical protein